MAVFKSSSDANEAPSTSLVRCQNFWYIAKWFGCRTDPFAVCRSDHHLFINKKPSPPSELLPSLISQIYTLHRPAPPIPLHSFYLQGLDVAPRPPCSFSSASEMSGSLLAYMTGDKPLPFSSSKRPSIGPGRNLFRSPEEESDLRKQMMEIQFNEVTGGGDGGFFRDSSDSFALMGGGGAEAGLALTSSTGESSPRAGAHRIVPPPSIHSSEYSYASPARSDTHHSLPSNFTPEQIQHPLSSPPPKLTEPLPASFSPLRPSFPFNPPQYPPSTREEFNPRFRYPSLSGSTAVASNWTGDHKYRKNDKHSVSVSVAPSTWSTQHELDDDDYLIGTSGEKANSRKWRKKAAWWILILLALAGAGVVIGVEVNKKKNSGTTGGVLAGAGEDNSTSTLSSDSSAAWQSTSTTAPLSSATIIFNLTSSISSSPISNFTSFASNATTSTKSRSTRSSSTTAKATSLSTTLKPQVEVIRTRTSSTTSHTRVQKSSSKPTTTVRTSTKITTTQAPSVTCTFPFVVNGLSVGENIETLKHGVACPTASDLFGIHSEGKFRRGH